jgi:hypothetical protein
MKHGNPIAKTGSLLKHFVKVHHEATGTTMVSIVKCFSFFSNRSKYYFYFGIDGIPFIMGYFISYTPTIAKTFILATGRQYHKHKLLEYIFF